MKRAPRQLLGFVLLIALVVVALGSHLFLDLPATSVAAQGLLGTPTPVAAKSLPLLITQSATIPGATVPGATDRNFQRQAEAALLQHLKGGESSAAITGATPASWPVLTLPPAPIALETARAAAHYQMQITAAGDASGDWPGAKIAAEFALYDLAGEVTAYHFVVHNAGQPAGYLTVAALALPNPVLEFATSGTSPLAATAPTLQTASVTALAPDHPLYLGLLGYAYEVADAAPDSRTVINLLDGATYAIPTDVAATPLRSLVQPAPPATLSTQATSAYRLIGGVPDWNQFWGSYGCWSGCAPTSGANVMGYWDNNGYSNLVAGSEWQGAVNDMRLHMNTVCTADGGGSTNVGSVSSGVVNYATAKGYTFASELWCSDCSVAASYANYQGEIDASRPVLVDVIGHAQYGNHSIVGVGYDSAGNYLIIHDNWPTTAENVYLQYGSGYSSIFMHPVRPAGTTQDTTPPTGDYTSPSNGAIVGRTVTLAATASDAQSGVKEVHFTAKWNNEWRLIANDTSAPYRFDWDLCAAGVPDGDIELGLDIYDNAGNVFHLHTVHANPHITKSYNCSPATATWSVDYWNNKYLAGSVNWHTSESGAYIFRDWGDNGPGGGIQVNEWSARYTRTAYFPGGDYRFHCQHDDGCRIYIDGQLRLDAWWDSSFDGHDWGGYLAPGNHEIRVESYDNQGGARLEAWWQGPGFLPSDQSCDANAWCGEYWGNRALSGTPAMRRNEGATLSFNWGDSGPDPTFPSDGFSTRFRRNADFACGVYRFHVNTDDGVKLWIDDVIRLDQWRDQATSYSFDVNLADGVHALRVEHYENGGGASLGVWWEQLSACTVSVAIEHASTHYVKPGDVVAPVVRIGVTAGTLDGGRGDALLHVAGDRLGATSPQPIYGIVASGAQYTFDVANNANFRMTAPTTEGVYSSLWRVRANGALVGEPATINVTVDGTPPMLSALQPSDGTFLNTSQVTLRVDVADGLSGVDQVQFFVGYDDGVGQGWTWYNLGWDIDGGDGWSMPWDGSSAPDQGGVAFYAYAWDRAGNGEGIGAWNITLDRTPPTFAFAPLPATQRVNAIDVRWVMTDTVAGADHIDLEVRRDSDAWESWQTVPGGTLGAWFIGELDHRYSFRARVVDRAGNVRSFPATAEANTVLAPCTFDAFEPDSVPMDASTLAPGDVQAHTFCGAGDRDWVTFYAEAGGTYTIETADLNGLTDTVLELYSSDGVLMLASNDDIDYPVNLASRIVWQASVSGWYAASVRQWGDRIAGDDVRYMLLLQADIPTPTPTATPWMHYMLHDRATCEGIDGAWSESDRRCQMFQWTTAVMQTLEVAEGVTLQSTIAANHGALIVHGSYQGFFLGNDGVITNYGRMTVGTDPLANNTIIHNYGELVDTRFSNGGTVDNHCIGRVVNPTIDSQQIINSPGDPACNATATPTPEQPAPLVLHAIAPAQGLANVAQTVIVTGVGLRPDTALRIGDVLLRNYALVDVGGGMARAVVPPNLAPGVYPVSATNPNGVTFTLLAAYTVMDAVQLDLSISESDLWFDPLPVRQGRPVQVGVNVHRSGGAETLTGVQVTFYVDSVAPDSRLDTVLLPPLPPGVDVVDSVAVLWTPATPGAHTIFVLVDPQDRHIESSEVNNTAQWTLEVQSYTSPGDTAPPIVTQVTPDNGAQLTTAPSVALAIGASDNVAVTSMYLVERVYSNAARRWMPIQQSGWIDFNPTDTFIFSPVGGARYLQVWVADAAGNIATVAQQALINYLRTDDDLLEGQVRVYRFYLASGETWQFTVDALAGDPDLYVWNPEGRLIGYSNRFDLSDEATTITAAQSGYFQVEVHGYRDSRYTLHAAAGAVVAEAIVSTDDKALPAAPAVDLTSAPAGQQVLPAAPVAASAKVFLPVALR
ncbi:MAG TPA: hypothetical protein GX400_01790 [Chloroflexi bacterium]|nr:hypothetical protein [Chloroflexota bacterium]